MHSQALTPRAEILRGAERIGEDEHAPLRPPERDLSPEAASSDRNELELPDTVPRHDVMQNVEPRRDYRAIAVVVAEQLDHADRSPGRTDALVQPVPVERVDQPDAAVRPERMRAALHEFVGDPAESVSELVAIADLHSGESTGTV